MEGCVHGLKSSADHVGVTGISPDLLIAHLDEVLASHYFKSSQRCRSMLKYLVEYALANTAEHLKERTIGIEVFGRKPEYDTASDPIVRTTAAEIRKRLAQCYHEEHSFPGRPEKETLLRIELPLGSYIPAFVFLESPSSPQEERGSEIEAPSSLVDGMAVEPHSSLDGQTKPCEPETVPADAPSRRTYNRILRWGLPALAIALCLLIFLHFRTQQARNNTTLLSVLIEHKSKVTAVVGDGNLQAYRMMFHKQVSLAAYIDRSYLQALPIPSDAFGEGARTLIARSSSTSVACVNLSMMLDDALGHGAIDVKHPHDLSMRDFQHGDVLLFGGPWINPWGQLFEDRLNFKMIPLESDPSTSGVVNSRPRAAEPVSFMPHQQGNLKVDYARIGFLPNLNGTGHVLLLGATSEDSLEAAGRFMVSQQSERQVLDLFHVSSPAQLPPFEVVLEVQGLMSVSGSMRIVAWRAVGSSN